MLISATPRLIRESLSQADVTIQSSFTAEGLPDIS
jgi:hypothetical protein